MCLSVVGEILKLFYVKLQLLIHHLVFSILILQPLNYPHLLQPLYHAIPSFSSLCLWEMMFIKGSQKLNIKWAKILHQASAITSKGRRAHHSALNHIWVLCGPDRMSFIATSNCREAAWPATDSCRNLLGSNGTWKPWFVRADVTMCLILILLQEVTLLSGKRCAYSAWHPQRGHILLQLLHSIIHILIQRQYIKRLYKMFCLIIMWIIK